MLLDLGARALRLLPPEAAHRATIGAIQMAGRLLPSAAADDPRLAVRAFGRNFPNPLGLAAGFDKNAQVPDAMLRLGFGFVECGTVTPRPQPGNPGPRLFRLPADRAVINRMGFNNDGMENVAARLERRRRTDGIIGLNIGANKDSGDRIADYRSAFARLASFADYITINVSSPNTPGLRSLQNREELEHLLGSLAEQRAKLQSAIPLLLKIAPDLETPAIDDVADVALAFGLDAIIATNTTIERPSNLRDRNREEAGGLSGAPLFRRSTEVLKQLRERVADKLVLVGVGGVSSGADAYEKMRAGAMLVQLYTALALQGPELISRIKRELIEVLKRDGFQNISQAVGADVR